MSNRVFFVRSYPAESSSPRVFVRERPPQRNVSIRCDYDPERGVLSVPAKIEVSPGEWIINPLADICRQWRVLRAEALAELKKRRESPYEG